MSVARLDNGVTLSYAEHGRVGDPVVVLLPGPTDSWHSYDPVLTSLPDGVRAVAVSLRGHAGSSKPATGYRIEDLAADVVPLLDALEIERALIGGHSGSGLVARRVALDHPDRVGGLILEAAPTTLRDDADLRRFVDGILADLTEPLDRGFARSFVEDTSTERLPTTLVDQLVDDLLDVPIVAWKEMFASLLEYDDTAELSSVSVPVMLIWGDCDRLVPRTMQDELLRLLPRARLTIYQGASHTPRWEQPQRFAHEVATFTSGILG